MADEADPGNVPAVKNIGSRAAYRLGPRKAKQQFGGTENSNPSQSPERARQLADRSFGINPDSLLQ